MLTSLFSPLATGSEKPGSPITIQAMVSGTGDDTSGGKISFKAAIENQRAALLLAFLALLALLARLVLSPLLCHLNTGTFPT